MKGLLKNGLDDFGMPWKIRTDQGTARRCERDAQWGTIRLPRTRVLAGCTPIPVARSSALPASRRRTRDLTPQRDGLSSGLDSARPGDSRVGVRRDHRGRSRRDRIDSVVTLKGHPIHRVRLEERIDTNAATGERVFPVLGAIAHLERRRIPGRMKDGLRAARKPGRTPGRPPVSDTAARERHDLVERGPSVTPGGPLCWHGSFCGR